MSSNHKAIVAIGVLMMGLGALISTGGLRSQSATDSKAQGWFNRHAEA